MSGLIGGTIGQGPLGDMLEVVETGADETSWTFETQDTRLGVTHHRSDPQGVTAWDDGKQAGIVYGTITNLEELGLTKQGLFERVLDRPIATAAAVEGSFVVSVVDAAANRIVVFTDKLGARPCYYTSDGPFVFGTRLAALLQRLDEQTIDEQAVSDMLLMGHMWSDSTLLEEVKAIRPATVLEVVDGERSTERYWKPDFEEAPPGEEYLTELVRRYRRAVRRSASTFPGRAGIWLSGGLDSRTTAGALVNDAGASFESLQAYTYDANPPTNDNPRLGSEVARRLGIEYTQVPLTAETFGDHFERVIEATDGMVRWNTTLNLSPTFTIQSPSPVMFEGMQGELVGDHPFRHHLTDFGSVVESQYSSDGHANPSDVMAVLEPDVDPFGSLKREAGHTDETGLRKQVLDIHFQNYYRGSLSSNAVMRERVGSRVIHADGDLLEWCARLPHRYRKGAFPMDIGDGGIPYGTSRAKLELIRRIDRSLADVPYERTKVKPSWPYEAHVAGFIGNVILGRLRSKPTYGNGELADFWIRDEHTRVHERVTELVQNARSRDIFDGDVLQDLYARHMDGANNSPMLAQVTTLEYWFQQHID